MNKERLYLFDTTLRDGAQTAGIEFSLEDKIRIAALLEEIGVDYVEGGYPGRQCRRRRVLPRGQNKACDLHRIRHDQAERPLGRQ